jgi:hypothetical protein
MTTPPPDGRDRDGGAHPTGSDPGPRTGEPLPDRPLPPPPPPPGMGAYPGAPPPPPGHHAGPMPGGPMPGYRPFDPFAALALAFGILVAPLGFVFAIVSVIRTSGGRRRGRGLAIAGLVVSVLLMAGAVALVAFVVSTNADRDASGAITKAGRVGVDDLRPGDCIKSFDEGSAFSVTGVPCADEHTTQVFTVYDLPDGDFPGLGKVVSESEKGCVDRVPAAVKGQVGDNKLGVAYLHPQEATWKNGDREVVCLIVSESGPLTQKVPTS